MTATCPRLRLSSPAFTVIELLVATSIIAILVAVLMPSLANAKEEARRVKCMANLHQILIAEHTYSKDHDSYFYSPPTDSDNIRMFPNYYQGQGGNAAVHLWEGLSNYIGNTEVLYCPSALRQHIQYDGGYGGGYYPQFKPGTIQKWGSLFWSDTHYGYMEFMMDTAPNDYILVFENPWLWGHATFYTLMPGWQEPWELDMTTGSTYNGANALQWLNADANFGTGAAPRAHPSGFNVGFVDGHIEWQRGGRMKGLRSYSQFFDAHGYGFKATY
ncbi:MAG: DUF1559 domain-containing protein [Verrucomicrobiae bacterium]|nr:DUF1559 domain-containing protein [Verrucomicrobiae bacterium]